MALTIKIKHWVTIEEDTEAFAELKKAALISEKMYRFALAKVLYQEINKIAVNPLDIIDEWEIDYMYKKLLDVE